MGIKKCSRLSDMWNEVKQKLSNDQNASDFIKNASLNITLPGTLTINIPYIRPDEYINDKQPGDKEINFIATPIKKISDELTDAIKKDPVNPIRDVTFNLSTNKSSEK